VPRLERAPGVGLRVVAATEAPPVPRPGPIKRPDSPGEDGDGRL
jgi:hypothetical protein